MSTKINTEYYGEENTWGVFNFAKYSSYSPDALARSGKYTGGAFDTSATPWGIGKSSLSSNAVFLPQKGEKWTITRHENPRKNTPLYLYFSANNSGLGAWYAGEIKGAYAGADRLNLPLFMNRYSPSVNRPDPEHPTTICSTLPVDNGNSVTMQNTYNNYPVTYLDYQHIKAYINTILYKEVGSNEIKTVYGINALSLKNVDYVVRVCWLLYDTNSQFDYVTGSVTSIPLDMPDEFKTRYYGENTDGRVTPWKHIQYIGYWDDCLDTDGVTPIGYGHGSSTSHFTNRTAWTTPQGGYSGLGTSYIDAAYGSISTEKQVFDDVSYHWEYGITPRNSANQFDINPVETGDVYTSGDFQQYAYMVIDDAGGLTKTEAYCRAILHEVAFAGFPIAPNASELADAIGSDDVYLPVFDEHLITTGRFVKGAAALSLPNAVWGNIFDDTMPLYDPDYIPYSPPIPDPIEDSGYLNNFPVTSHTYSSNYRVYLLSSSEYNAFIQDVNSLYLTDPDGFDKCQLDFKGTNPNDYIIGIYGYPFQPCELEVNQPSINIELGAVLLPNAQGARILPSNIKHIKNLGRIDLTYGNSDVNFYGDFRDYEPYTSIDLYVPLCGTVNLDPAQVIGHTIGICLVYDIMTGNATACIYRDGQTLIKTISGQVGASLPLTAARMGDYQNAVKSTEMALRQNELKAATSAATVAIGIGAALAAPETAGVSLAVGAAAITGVSGLVSSAASHSQLEYDLTHKQPQIATVSSANGSVAQNISTLYPVCYVKQCLMLNTYNADTYAHTIGHATVKNTTIGAETTDGKNSLLVCSNADLSGIPATAAEISAIQSLLTGGIYV